MARLLLFNMNSAEISTIKNTIKKEPVFEVAVVQNFDELAEYQNYLDGQLNLVLMGCGLEGTSATISGDYFFLQAIKQRWPDLRVILLSFDNELLDEVYRSASNYIDAKINLSEEGLKEDDILLRIKEVLSKAKLAKPTGKIPGVLLVDDEESILQTLSLVLKTGGFNRVYVAGDSQAAFKILQENLENIDVCLIDYNLKGETAEELIYAVNRLAPRIKIFIMSGEGKKSKFPWPQEVLKISSGFLSKPFNIGEIVLAIDEALQKETTESSDPRRKILVIDDSPESVALIENVFGSRFRVISAPDGETGLEKFKETKPDLVILDYKLPGKNGLEIMKELKKIASMMPKDRENLRVVVTTIEKNPQVYQQFMSLGVDSFLYKPLNVEELERVIKFQLNV